MSEPFDFKHCPACGESGLEKMFKPSGQTAYFCAQGCRWIGGHKEAEDLMAMKTRIEELENHIKELAGEAIDGTKYLGLALEMVGPEQLNRPLATVTESKIRSLGKEYQDPAHKRVKLQQDLLLAAIKYNALGMHMGRRCVALQFGEGLDSYEIQLTGHWPLERMECINPRRDIEEYLGRERKTEMAKLRNTGGLPPFDDPGIRIEASEKALLEELSRNGMDDAFEKEMASIARRYQEHEREIWKMLPRLEDVEAYTIHCPEDFNKRVFGNFQPDRPRKDKADIKPDGNLVVKAEFTPEGEKIQRDLAEDQPRKQKRGDRE
jgi:hypothetical protein